MIGYVPRRWQALKDKWATLPEQDAVWAMYIQRDSDGLVHCAPLLSGMASTWASEIIHEMDRRGEWARR